MFSTQKTKILLLQGPTSGGKSSFMYGLSKGSTAGYLSFALQAALLAKSSSQNQLHILIQAVEVRKDETTYDLLAPGNPATDILAKGTRSNRKWYPASAKQLLVTGSAQIPEILATVGKNLRVQGNGIHKDSSRGFGIYEIVSVSSHLFPWSLLSSHFSPLILFSLFKISSIF
jgi:hypothetical protein